MGNMCGPAVALKPGKTLLFESFKSLVNASLWLRPHPVEGGVTPGVPAAPAVILAAGVL